MTHLLNKNALYSILTGLFFSFLFVSPTFAANTHHYVCGDWTQTGPWSCSSDVLDSTAWTSGGYDNYDYTDTFTGTFYVTFNTTATEVRLVCSNSCGDNHMTGSQVDYPISSSGTNGIDLIVNDAIQSGLISNFCVSDTPGECGTGGGGGGDETGTTTATSTPLIIAVNNNTFGLACIFFVLCLFAFAYFTSAYSGSKPV